jgi:para-aminobenzoate synthetase component I
LKNQRIIKAIQKMNQCGKEAKTFFFFIDYEMLKPLVYALEEIPEGIQYYFKDFASSSDLKTKEKQKIHLQAEEISFPEYKKAFDTVQKHLQRGDSYLLNLTMKTKIGLSHSLEEIYKQSAAPYKVFIPNKLVCFSPEAFVCISENKIHSFPMKGTIDAAIPNAKDLLLEDVKESCEHNTIVDLIRNDLSMVAKKVRLTKFKYIEEVQTNNKNLLQMSSEISGELDKNYQERIGDILFRLLPAGSISGAPKEKTVEIIKEAEILPRNYYTGVFGFFDGKDLCSAVAIRFIEKDKDNYYYRSGGGITTLSECEKEFQELKDKIYVPTI